LPKTAHPYPGSADYSEGWVQIAGYIFGGGLLEQDAVTLGLSAVRRVGMERGLPIARRSPSSWRPDLKWSDGKPITTDDYLFAWTEASKEENDYVGLDDPRTDRIVHHA